MSDVFAPTPVKTKSNGDVVAAIVDSAGTNKASVSAAGAVKVDGSAVTQPISDASLELAQASTTSGQKGPLVQGAVTTSAPSYTTAQTNPLSLTTAGALRVDGSAVTQPVSGTVTANAGTGTFNIQANASVNLAQVGAAAVSLGSKTSANSIPVVLASDQATLNVAFGNSGTVTDDYNTSAALAAGATVTLDSTNIASGTGHLVEATVGSSVDIKAQLGTWDGTTFTVKRTFFVNANTSLVYIPQRNDEITKATGATAKFRWSITNMDNANAADVYCSTTYWN